MTDERIKMKKYFILLICTAFLLTGCGAVGDGTSEAETTTVKTVTEAETTEATEAETEAETETTEATPDEDDTSFAMRVGTDPDSEAVLTRADIKSAYPAIMPASDGTMEWIVSLSLNEEGKEKFAQITADLAGTDTPLSIWVDDEMVCAPTVSTAIYDGNAVITGNFDEESAKELAEYLDPKSVEEETPASENAGEENTEE